MGVGSKADAELAGALAGQAAPAAAALSGRRPRRQPTLSFITTSLAFATAAITITTTALSLAGAFPAASLSSTVARAPSGGASSTTA